MTKTNIYDKITEIPKLINDRIFRLANFHLNLDNIQPALLIEDNVTIILYFHIDPVGDPEHNSVISIGVIGG